MGMGCIIPIRTGSRIDTRATKPVGRLARISVESRENPFVLDRLRIAKKRPKMAFSHRICHRLPMVVAAAVVMGVSGCSIPSGSIGLSNLHQTRTKTIPVSKMTDLTIEAANAPVTVTAEDRTSIELTFKLDISGATGSYVQAMAKKVKARVKINGGKVRITVDMPKRQQPMSGIGYSLDLKVPKNIVVNVRTTNGVVTVTGPFRECGLETANAPIVVSKVTQVTKASTTNGKVDASDLDGRITLDSSNGPIVATGVKPTDGVTATSSNGSIRIECMQVTTAGVHAETANAGITILLPKGTIADVDADTANAGKTISVTQGTGPKAIPVTAQTSNGGIDISYSP